MNLADSVLWWLWEILLSASHFYGVTRQGPGGKPLRLRASFSSVILPEETPWLPKVGLTPDSYFTFTRQLLPMGGISACVHFQPLPWSAPSMDEHRPLTKRSSQFPVSVPTLKCVTLRHWGEPHGAAVTFKSKLFQKLPGCA